MGLVNSFMAGTIGKIKKSGKIMIAGFGLGEQLNIKQVYPMEQKQLINRLSRINVLKPGVILVSACLLEIPCQYDGNLAKVRFDSSMMEKIKEKYHIIPVCPEQLGGLPTPRTPVEIINGNGPDVLEGKAKVETETGKDLTLFFIRGAKIVLSIAKTFNAQMMVTQKRSPSCSCKGIYNGKFNHSLVEGSGVTSALLLKEGIPVMDVDDFLAKF